VKYALRVAEQTLVTSRNEARERLGRIFDEMDLEQRTYGIHAHYPKEVLDGSLIMIALLQMVQEMRSALQIAERTHAQYEESRVRLWYPHISLAWLGVPPGPFISDDLDTTLQLRTVDTAKSTLSDSSEVHLTTAEAQEGLIEKGFVGVNATGRLPSGLAYSTLSDKDEQFGGRKRWRGFPAMLARFWSHPWALHARIRIAKVHRSFLHSRHLKHAMKNAIGVAILSFPAFMPVDSTGIFEFYFDG